VGAGPSKIPPQRRPALADPLRPLSTFRQLHETPRWAGTVTEVTIACRLISYVHGLLAAVRTRVESLAPHAGVPGAEVRRANEDCEDRPVARAARVARRLAR